MLFEFLCFFLFVLYAVSLCVVLIALRLRFDVLLCRYSLTFEVFGGQPSLDCFP